jgi:hypothetical protein
MAHNDNQRKRKMRENSNNNTTLNLSSQWVFEVGSHVHPGSWGKRILTVHTPNRSSDKTGKTSKHQQHRWTARDFAMGTMIGAGHFGKIYRATYVPRGDKEVDDAVKDYPLATNDQVALKCFTKSKVLTSRGDGGRALLLLRREVNIQSQYVCKRQYSEECYL